MVTDTAQMWCCGVMAWVGPGLDRREQRAGLALARLPIRRPQLLAGAG